MKHGSVVTPKERRMRLESELKTGLNSIGSIEFEGETVHCENLIGATTLPLGVAGPLVMQNNASAYIPLATTEGALVASVNRGCKAIAQSGGAAVDVEPVGVTRGPVFAVANRKEAKSFTVWLKKNFALLAETAAGTSNHLKLLRLDSKTVGTYVFVRFSFDTGDAMGMNMATIAADRMADRIRQETGIRCIAVSGNYCIDKKPALINFLQGRGKSGWAEAVIPAPVLADVLKTTPEALHEVWMAKCIMGSIASGSLGYNAHYANVVAAFFAATGQDLAHVVEGSMGVTAVRVLENRDTHISVYLPAIMIGTVGGGTKLKVKQEAISITGVSSSVDLAKVLAGAVLAGELSLLASLAEGSLAKAHSKLGR